MHLFKLNKIMILVLLSYLKNCDLKGKITSISNILVSHIMSEILDYQMIIKRYLFIVFVNSLKNR